MRNDIDNWYGLLELKIGISFRKTNYNKYYIYIYIMGLFMFPSFDLRISLLGF